eukprot:COSAG03_NODE_3669_length_1888_cov_7.520402_2_plen_61_part_00
MGLVLPCGTVCRDCVPGLYVWTTEGRLPGVPGGGWAAPVIGTRDELSIIGTRGPSRGVVA